MAIWAQQVDVYPVSAVVLFLAHVEGALLVLFLACLLVYFMLH